MAADPTLSCTVTSEWTELAPAGAWTTVQSKALEERVTAATAQVSIARKLVINMSGVRELDTLGAWLLERLISELYRSKSRSAISQFARALSGTV